MAAHYGRRRRLVEAERAGASTATETAPLVGAEDGFEWNPLHFHSLHVHDATLMWAGFILKPHNLFDGTPLYP